MIRVGGISGHLIVRLTSKMVYECIKPVVLGLTLLTLIGCSTVPPVQTLIHQGSSKALRPGDIIETATGSALTFDTLIHNLSKSQIIYIGESHNRPEDHRLQLEVLKGLQARNPGLILALEMLPREVQPWLDQYSQGLISEKEFLEKSEWAKNWGYPFDLYRGLFHWARARHLRMIGLNAPIEIVNRIAQKGLDSLSPSERNKVASEFHQDHPEHRAYLFRQYGHHPQGKIKNFDTFYEAQLAWEETMAETLSRTVASFSKGEQILVLLGKGHMIQNLGVPRFARIRVDHTFQTVLPVSADFPFPILDPKPADYIYLTE